MFGYAPFLVLLLGIGAAAGAILGVTRKGDSRLRGVVGNGCLGAIAAGLLAVVLGVVVGLVTDRRLGRSLEPREVHGRWVMTEASRALLHPSNSAARDSPYLIVLEPGGRGLVQGAWATRGNWTSLRAGPVRWQLGPSAEDRNVLALTTDDATITLSVTERSGILYLWKYFDDPDAGDCIEYARQRD